MDLKYQLLLAEKRLYPFRRWPRSQAQSVLFPVAGLRLSFRARSRCLRICARSTACRWLMIVAEAPLPSREGARDANGSPRSLTRALQRWALERSSSLPELSAAYARYAGRPVVSVYRKLSGVGRQVRRAF